MKKITAIFLTLAMMIMAVPMQNISAADVFSTSETYFIKNVYSGKYLEASGGINTIIYQNTFTASVNQQFKFKPTQSGAIAIIPVSNDAVRFDVSGAETNNGTKIKLYNQNMDFINAQHFKIKQNIDGTYRFSTELSNQDKVLEIGGPSKKNGAQIQLWDYIGAENQKWLIIPMSEANVDDSPIPDRVGFSAYQTYYNMEATSMGMRITNNNSMPIITTDEFRLDTLRDGEWEEYSPRQFTKFNKKPFSIPAQSSYDFVADLINASAKPLVEGNYRIVKKFSVKGSALPKFEVGTYFTAYNSMYTFTNEYYYNEFEYQPVFRTEYFKQSSGFDEIIYTDHSFSLASTDSNEIESVLKTILSIHKSDLRDSSNYSNKKIKISHPDYSIKFVKYKTDFNSKYSVEIGLCGTIGDTGYITMRHNGSLVKTIAVSDVKYNTLLSIIEYSI